MKKAERGKWIKQLTRENTLLERSLRMLAYHRSIRELGRASISNVTILGKGNITSWYYLKKDLIKNQKIILSEFHGKSRKKFSSTIVGFLTSAFHFRAAKAKGKNRKEEMLRFFSEFERHLAHSMGTIVYGYWGEPAVSARLRQALMKKISPSGLDNALSLISTPHRISGCDARLFPVSESVNMKRKSLIKKLGLTKRDMDLCETLSWLTFFYEFGERAGSHAYNALLKKLRAYSKNLHEYRSLFWYDPESLFLYISTGKKLSETEISKRKEMYILRIGEGRVRVITGAKARKIFREELSEKTNANVESVSGMPASPGMAVGKAKIIITREQQKKMRKGDILISTMTTPRLMPAVRKAAAIITDEGGMTAHAAIVARELKIPCIVGTKIATGVFRDGDLVELDAHTGTARRIK